MSPITVMIAIIGSLLAITLRPVRGLCVFTLILFFMLIALASGMPELISRTRASHARPIPHRRGLATA